MNRYWFTVDPDVQCQGLKMYEEYKAIKDNRFLGWVEYSNYWKEFYLTTDGITYTPVRFAKDVKQHDRGDTMAVSKSAGAIPKKSGGVKESMSKKGTLQMVAKKGNVKEEMTNRKGLMEVKAIKANIKGMKGFDNKTSTGGKKSGRGC